MTGRAAQETETERQGYSRLGHAKTKDEDHFEDQNGDDDNVAPASGKAV